MKGRKRRRSRGTEEGMEVEVGENGKRNKWGGGKGRNGRKEKG